MCGFRPLFAVSKSVHPVGQGSSLTTALFIRATLYKV